MSVLRSLMRARGSAVHEALRSSMWLVPSLLMLAAVLGAISTIALDRVAGDRVQEAWWGLGIGAEGMRATLSTVAASVMTVAGVAFSMTVVVLQLASTQYTPRVIRNFRRDRFIHWILGLYTGTFVYSLLVMRTIGSGRRGAEFTAPVSVTVALVLGSACMVALFAMIHHVAQTVQVSSIVARVQAETQETIERLLPERAEADARCAPCERPRRDDPPLVVPAPRDGYVEFIDTTGVDERLGVELVCIEVRVGDYVRRGEALASAWPATARGCATELERAFALSSERTIRQDIRHGLQILVDVALRALSPSLNDPTTALICIDALGALLREVAVRRTPSWLTTRNGVTVYAPQPSGADLVTLAFGEIIAAGASFLRVERAVLDACRALARCGTASELTDELPRIVARVAYAVEHVGPFEPERRALLDEMPALVREFERAARTE